MTGRQITVTLPQNPADANNDGRVSFDELLRSTVFIIALLMIGLNVCGVAVGMLVTGGDIVAVLTAWLGWVLWLSLGLSVLGGVAIGVWRQLWYEREVKEAKIERDRRWQIEDEERNLRLGLGEHERTTRLTQVDVDQAALLMLRHYFNTGEIARGKVPGVSDIAWNKANALLQQRKIRTGNARHLNYSTLAEAWAAYLDGKIKARSYVVGEDAELIESPPPSPTDTGRGVSGKPRVR